METVTAETAEENGVTLQHVSKVKAATADADDYKKFGGYITYLNPEDGTFNSTAFSSAGITDNYKLAKYDSTVTEEKTQFRTKCQTALCASCGKELTGKAQENLKKPVVGETLTVADYKEIYGDWVYTVTAKAAGSKLTTIGDTLTLNLTLSKNASDSNKTDVTLYATFVLDGVTTTEKISCSTVDNGNTFNAETGYRAFVVKLDAASTKDGTNLPSGAYIILSEDSDGEYTLKIDTDGAAATHTPETYAGAGEDPKEEIEWDGNHTTHTLNAMEHYGVKYITSDDLSNSHVHYLECSGCDLAYYPETVATETATAFENNKCKTCGAPNVGTGWIDITIKANSEFTTGDKFMVAANTELKIGYSEYQSFGGKKYQMTGYKTLTNVEGTANGIKVGSTAEAILEFALKETNV